MNKKLVVIVLGLVILFPMVAQAQLWKKVKEKVERKAEEKVDEVLNGKSSKPENDMETPQGVLAVDEPFTFASGSEVLFEDKFSSELLGKMPQHWKTNGSGSVVEIPGMEGKWLKMESNATYKLKELFEIPQNATIEFDLVTRTDKPSDLGELLFGFSKDNSSRNWISDAYNNNSITTTNLHFWNKTVGSSSSDTRTNNHLDFPLNNFGNATLRISIEVEGEMMRVYVNKSKVLDAEMFEKDRIKYFFISSPLNMKHGAQLFMGNFKIAKK